MGLDRRAISLNAGESQSGLKNGQSGGGNGEIERQTSSRECCPTLLETAEGRVVITISRQCGDYTSRFCVLDCWLRI